MNDQIKVTKPGILNGCIGEILSVSDTTIKVNFGKDVGEWSFKEGEYELLIQPKFKPLNAMEYNAGMYETEIKEMPAAKTKRQYVKRGKPKEVKQTTGKRGRPKKTQS